MLVLCVSKKPDESTLRTQQTCCHKKAFQRMAMERKETPVDLTKGLTIQLHPSPVVDLQAHRGLRDPLLRSSYLVHYRCWTNSDGQEEEPRHHHFLWRNQADRSAHVATTQHWYHRALLVQGNGLQILLIEGSRVNGNSLKRTAETCWPQMCCT